MLSVNIYENIDGTIKEHKNLTSEMTPAKEMAKFGLTNHGVFPLTFYQVGTKSCDEIDIYMGIVE